MRMLSKFFKLLLILTKSLVDIIRHDLDKFLMKISFRFFHSFNHVLLFKITFN